MPDELVKSEPMSLATKFARLKLAELPRPDEAATAVCAAPLASKLG